MKTVSYSSRTASGSAARGGPADAGFATRLLSPAGTSPAPPMSSARLVRRRVAAARRAARRNAAPGPLSGATLGSRLTGLLAARTAVETQLRTRAGRPGALIFSDSRRSTPRALFSTMSTTRQSPHICSLRVPPANIEWPPSLPSMFSTIWRVPKGLPQRTQLNGSASFSVTGSLAFRPISNRGTSAIAFSGQVFTHSPHCTQLRSMKRRLRRLGRIDQRRLRAGADARLAQRAGLLVDGERAERRARGKRNGPFSSVPRKMVDGEVERGALFRRQIERRRLRLRSPRGSIPTARPVLDQPRNARPA